MGKSFKPEVYAEVPVDGALCKEIDPELWFPSDSGGPNGKASYDNARAAKKFCAKCPISLKCLMAAVYNKEEYGIWGGSTPRDRKGIHTKEDAKTYIVKLKKQFIA